MPEYEWLPPLCSETILPWFRVSKWEGNMSDNYENDDLEIDDDGANDIRNLRKAANESKKVQNENAQLRRELAFAKAGLPLDDPKMSYFVKGYDGDLEPDAIREAATSAGFLAVPQENSQQQAQQQSSMAAQQRVMSASAGAMVEDTSEGAAIARMEMAMQEGGIEAMLDVARQYGIPTSIDQ